MSKQWTVYCLFGEECASPFYVGCTSMKIRERVSHHRSAARRGVKGHPIIRAAVDPEQVQYLVLEVFDNETEAHAAERRWISELGRRPVGLLVNRSGGGKSAFDPHPETKALMVKIHKGNTYRKGIPRPDAVINNSRPVSVFTQQGEYVATYPSGRKASQAYPGISPKTISSVIHGRLQCAKADNGLIYQFRSGYGTKAIPAVNYRDTWKNRRN